MQTYILNKAFKNHPKGTVLTNVNPRFRAMLEAREALETIHSGLIKRSKPKKEIKKKEQKTEEQPSKKKKEDSEAPEA